MKNILDGINTSSDAAKDKINELLKLISSRNYAKQNTVRKKDWGRKEQSIGELWKTSSG